MASKFNNRLVGTIILVAIGIIILPGLLDGKKKHYQDEFTAIPLVLKPGDGDELDATPSVSQQLPNQSPELPEKAVEQSRPSGSQSAAPLPDAAGGSSQPETFAPPEMKTILPATVKPESKTGARPEKKLVPKPQAPNRQAWVVQLGAIKNADNVLKIVDKLRLSGYRVYTSPSAPVQGQITRIFVGPDASKEKLQSALGKLHQLSGLNGKLRSYRVR